MRSTFFGVELARKALMAQQIGLDVTGNNIANANSAGYTRQIPNLVANDPYTILAKGRNLSLGSGSAVETITRARDAFVDRQFRWETSKQQYWSGLESALGKVESMLNEPSTSSLSKDLSNFFNAWGTLANDPQNGGARSVVLQRALAVVETFHHIDQQLTVQKQSIDATIDTQMTQINNITKQIATLNDQIKRAEVAGDTPNSLMDQRDSLVDELSSMVNVRVEVSRDTLFTDRVVNNFQLLIGSDTSTQVLVDNGSYRELAVDTDTATDQKQIVWKDNGVAINLGKEQGSLMANLDLRNDFLPHIADQLDQLAKGFAEAVNEIHEAGKGLDDGDPGGHPFFVDSSGGTSTADFSAKNLYVNSDIEDDVNMIAARAVGNEVGDGSIAQEMASLINGWTEHTEGSPTLPGISIGEFYGSVVAELGAKVQTAKRMRTGEDVLVNQLYNQREQASGVSLDEEMTNLIKFQKSYAAAARVVTMMDELLDKIVNGMGVTR